MSSEHVEVLERLRGVLEHGKMGDKCLIAPDLVTAAIAALSAPQSGDWVLVPREPTEAMLSAAGRLQACECGFVGDMSPMDGEEYAAMLAAAPQPPAEAQAQGGGEVVDEGSRSVTRQLLHWGGVPVHVTGTVTTSPGNWSLIDAALAAQQGGES